MTGDRAESVPGEIARRRARSNLNGELTDIGKTPVIAFEPRGTLSAQILDEALWSGDLRAIARKPRQDATQTVVELSSSSFGL